MQSAGFFAIIYDEAKGPFPKGRRKLQHDQSDHHRSRLGRFHHCLYAGRTGHRVRNRHDRHQQRKGVRRSAGHPAGNALLRARDHLRRILPGRGGFRHRRPDLGHRAQARTVQTGSGADQRGHREVHHPPDHHLRAGRHLYHRVQPRRHPHLRLVPPVRPARKQDHRHGHHPRHLPPESQDLGKLLHQSAERSRLCVRRARGHLLRALVHRQHLERPGGRILQGRLLPGQPVPPAEPRGPGELYQEIRRAGHPAEGRHLLRHRPLHLPHREMSHRRHGHHGHRILHDARRVRAGGRLPVHPEHHRPGRAPGQAASHPTTPWAR